SDLPMDHHWRMVSPLGNLQISHDFLPFKKDFNSFQRWIHHGYRSEKCSECSFVTVHLFRAAWDRITADTVVLIRQIESLTSFFLFSFFFLLLPERLVFRAELFPFSAPQIGIEAIQSSQHLLDILPLDPFERIDAPGVIEDVSFDFVEAFFCHGVRLLLPFCPRLSRESLPGRFVEAT